MSLNSPLRESLASKKEVSAELDPVISDVADLHVGGSSLSPYRLATDSVRAGRGPGTTHECPQLACPLKSHAWEQSVIVRSYYIAFRDQERSLHGCPLRLSQNQAVTPSSWNILCAHTWAPRWTGEEAAGAPSEGSFDLAGEVAAHPDPSDREWRRARRGGWQAGAVRGQRRGRLAEAEASAEAGREIQT